jgi:outer membrane lipoprotein SlyB
MRYAATLIVTLLLAGCQSTLTGDAYSRADARRIQTVQYGSVEATRPVVIEGTKSAAGTLAGGAVGGIAGSSVGGGKGSQIAAVVGAVAGGVAGSAAEEGLTRRQGIDITVRLDSGELISVVQELAPESSFRVGDRVRVLTLDGETRIAR